MTFKRAAVSLLIIGIIGGILFPRYLHRAEKRHYCDFRVYHHAAQVFLSGGDIYFRDREDVTPYKYSPAFAFFTAPLGTVSVKTAAAIFFMLNLLMTGLLFWYAGRLFIAEGLSSRQVILAYVIPAVILLRLIFQTWDAGQVHILMCLLTVMGLYSYQRNRELSGSAFFAGAILVKYVPAAFLGYFLARGRWARVIGIISFIGIFLALPALVVGFSKAWGYLSAWIPSIVNTSLDPSSYVDYKNQSVYSLILRFFTETDYHINFLNLSFRQGLMLGYAVAAALYVLALAPGRGERREDIDMAYVCALLPLFNPNAWMGNFVFLIPAIMVLVSYLLRTRGRDKFVLSCLVIATLLIAVPAQDIVGNDLENLAESFSCVAFGALSLAVGLLRLKFFADVSAQETEIRQDG